MNDDVFVHVAVSHGLLLPERADDLLAHANEQKVTPSDAALSLSLMQPWEIEAAELLTQPDKLAPGYVLTGLIGCGAAGIVFRAEQLALNRDVALKTINARARLQSTSEARLQLEAQAIARLHHPNIVTAYDSGFYQGRFCIAMELVEGESLDELISREASVEEAAAWQIARQIAAALAHADASGITHRDIKPANILLCNPPDGTKLSQDVPFVKVTDFGLARDKSESRLTTTGSTLGTPAYVAPEQLHDTAVDCRADIYALGATVFHMLAGEAPHANQSPMKVILQKTIDDDSWREKLPDAVSEPSARLFRRMTETDPADRPRNYHELLDLLDNLLTTQFNNRPPHDAVSQSLRSTVLLEAEANLGRASRSRFLSRTVAIAIITAILLAVTFWRHPWSFGPASPVYDANADVMVTKAIDWKPAGIPQPLFNGYSAPVRVVSTTGWWNPTAAMDGARVLAGNQGATLTIPLRAPGATSSNSQFQLNVNLPDEQTVVQISTQTANDVSESAHQLSGRLIIRHSEALYFEGETNTPVKNDGETALQTVKLTEPTPDDVLYRRIRIRREANRIRVAINGHEMPMQLCDPKAEASVSLRCLTGRVNVGDLTIVQLVPE